MNPWTDLAGDVGGLMLFLLWLALPPLYVVVVGRHYVRRCRDEFERVQDYVDAVLPDHDEDWSTEEPTEEPAETTAELPAVSPHDPPPIMTTGQRERADHASGKHRLHE